LDRDSLKVAVVGLGKMGLVHSSVLSVLPNVQLAAVCEKSGLIRRFSRKIFRGVRVVDDVNRLSELELDAVFITTPIPSHFYIARNVYLNGIARHLFVEKTLTQSYEQSRELCDLAYDSEGVNMVGYLRRFYVTFLKAKDLLSKDAIGQVFSFKAHAYSSDFLGAKTEKATSVARGGVLRDLGCHAIDVALWFFGELQIGSEELSSGNGAISVDFEVKSVKGAKGTFEVSWCMKDYRMPEVGFVINGSEGNITVNDDRVELRSNSGKSFVWYRHDLNDHVPFWLGLPEYYREDLHFIRSIIEEGKAEPSFYDAARVDEVIGLVEKEKSKNANLIRV
jgi:predicted dehydrogenase